MPKAPINPSPPPPPAPVVMSPLANSAKAPVLGKLEAKLKPPRIVLNALEGFGKTSCAAYASEVAILEAPRETGYETLLGAGLVPSVDTARIETWPGLLALLDQLGDECKYKTVALDAMGGFERLCHEHVCSTQYKDSWDAFTNYQQGYEVSISEWIRMLSRLDRIHDNDVSILILSHCRVRNFKNPLGPDFDRYESNVHPKTWDVTKQMFDAVLFGTFRTFVDNPDKAAKGQRVRGIGTNDRVIYTMRHDAYDAKNRYGMDRELDIPNDPSQIWTTIRNAIAGKDQPNAT